MKVSDILIFALSFTLCTACAREYKIEQRARQQVAVSLPDEILSFCPQASSIKFENLETVYVNDSICILQLVASYSPECDIIREEDLQYVYFADMISSRFAGQFIFKEAFRTVPCMSPGEIKEGLKLVKQKNESVYESLYSFGMPINKPFDAEP